MRAELQPISHGSQRLGAAAMELLWALAADAPAVVIEANIWPDNERNQHRIRELTACVVEVHCVCPVAIAMRRYVSRRGRRHPAHAETARNLSPDSFARCNQPLGVGTFIAVDTTAPVDVDELAYQIRARLGLLTSGTRGLFLPSARRLHDRTVVR
jgi:hypothetical protein